MENFHFKVNLQGMIELLYNHLYSTPDVYIRELIQNSVDAITARKQIEPHFEGKIELEVFENKETSRYTLCIEDNGIGLTEEEVHHFLSQIGQTSKGGSASEDFIGRFGVGLLSCFIVSDEIILITRSIHSDQTIEWRGKPDGTYKLRKIQLNMEPGTKIFLQSKEGYEHYYQPQKVQDLVRHYGEFLPYPLFFQEQERIRLNAAKAPWEMSPTEALQYGKERNEEEYLDAIPLCSSLGEATGIAYILPHAVQLKAQSTHRVYVKRMLLSETVEKILPDWAFFVTAILNVDRLRLTASREEFFQDGMLELVRKELGDSIKQYLIQLAQKDPLLLKKIIKIHYASLKLLAVEDQELYALFIRWLPFETTFGRMTIEEILENSSIIYYTNTVDEFRQIEKVAKAQGVCVINGGYMTDAQLIENLPSVFPERSVEEMDADALARIFIELEQEEQVLVSPLVEKANTVLQKYDVICQVKKFQPTDLPVLFTTNEEANFLRFAKQSKEVSGELFASVLDQLTSTADFQATLVLNMESPIIQKLIQETDNDRLSCMMEMLYVQALLLGNHPLGQEEIKLLNKGMLQLMDWGLPQ